MIIIDRWRAHRAKAHALNDLLAAMDQPSRLDREHWTAEMLDRLAADVEQDKDTSAGYIPPQSDRGVG